MTWVRQVIIITTTAALAAVVHFFVAPPSFKRVDREAPKIWVEDGVFENSGLRFVTLDRAAELHDDPLVCFVDASDSQDFAAGHIARALHVPVESVSDGSLPQNVLSYSPVMTLVVYCATGCNVSAIVAERLIEMGFDKTLIMDGKFADWRDAGYPVE
ncbi:MAG: rhodanese-like domain-containing protein [Planctomycetes bacterium]|nr:rhodanese-like domain-containing protein [Planctomycetota bacterium]